MTAALALVLSYSGFAALGFATERHHRGAWGRSPERRTVWALRFAGAALLLVALALCVRASAGSNGVLQWLGSLSVAGIALVFLLPFAPRLAAFLAAALPLLAALAAAFGR